MLHVLGLDPRDRIALSRMGFVLEKGPVYVARVDWVKRQMTRWAMPCGMFIPLFVKRAGLLGRKWGFREQILLAMSISFSVCSLLAGQQLSWRWGVSCFSFDPWEPTVGSSSLF